MSYEIWFTCPCPAYPCNGEGPAYEWKHSNCGGYEKVDRYGNLRCIRCGQSGPLYEWKFKCSDHTYGYGNYFSYKHGLQMVLNMAEDDATVDFISSLILQLKEWKRDGYIKRD